ncbi:hypothetical protein BD780_001536 [Clostridium tetanomorphum]|uniref:Uncharacterized protein n=1 Tax=Clostridium tetanomorphum TaxID=1553 RepID=A0A923J0K8_CLOTT|nr:hypothetical protein [Clostridium tetanomorphum]MBC2396835.1 hypothetical protein [Clostridium tetanomorphum]MBP1863203.1 hypothetical protein [Clostridium tetanomorphum]NRS84311.1 hypothetical protein [Clostridium tetanomorphum]NRZ97525.1 hypothetical protein [Clostridium tetanomorphum]SQB92308.1 Uncharacterised protein [Clostridium tetanomorphum]
MSKKNKKYTIRKIEDNLYGSRNNITESTDVDSSPFPFTEENYNSNEQYHYGAIDNNRPL